MKVEILIIGDSYAECEHIINEININLQYNCKFIHCSEIEKIDSTTAHFYIINTDDKTTDIITYLNNNMINEIIVISNLNEEAAQRNFLSKLTKYQIIDILFTPIYVEKLIFSMEKSYHNESCYYYQCVEKMDKMAVITNSNHEIIYANNAFLKETGYSLNEIINRKSNVLKSDEHSLMFYDNLKHTIEAGLTWKGTFRNKRKDNSLYWEDASIFPIEVKDQIMYVKTASDVTNREEMLSEKHRETKLASTIQRSLLPEDLFHEKIVIKGGYFPMENVSGDIYYWKKISEDMYCVFLADVIGHGVASALMTTSIIAIITELINKNPRPDIMLKELNNRIMSLFKSKDLSVINYFTAAYLVIDTKNNKVLYSNCGHPKAYLTMNEEVITLQEINFPVGLFNNAEFSYGTFDYCNDVQIFLYTDGLIETEAGKDYGVEKLEAELSKFAKYESKKNLISIIEENLVEDMEEDIKDDVTVISIEIKVGE